MYQHIKELADGAKIQVNNDYSLNVPDTPIIPFIEGIGIAPQVQTSTFSGNIRSYTHGTASNMLEKTR